MTGAPARISSNAATEITGAETRKYKQPTKCLTDFHNECMRCTWQITPISGQEAVCEPPVNW